MTGNLGELIDLGDLGHTNIFLAKYIMLQTKTQIFS
uniref:Uncharacterized protein n=1 Tax=Candidatus Nitrotoga fabula TaxID=2182327 RepID=A0A2X0R9B6_9PROT|nr:protein of unknown function [Candidatus Nitrotoga fabula]